MFVIVVACGLCWSAMRWIVNSVRQSLTLRAEGRSRCLAYVQRRQQQPEGWLGVQDRSAGLLDRQQARRDVQQLRRGACSSALHMDPET